MLCISKTLAHLKLHLEIFLKYLYFMETILFLPTKPTALRNIKDNENNKRLTLIETNSKS